MLKHRQHHQGATELVWRPSGKSALALVGDLGVSLYHFPIDFYTLAQDAMPATAGGAPHHRDHEDDDGTTVDLHFPHRPSLPSHTMSILKQRIKKEFFACPAAQGLAFNPSGDLLAWTSPSRFVGGHLSLLSLYTGQVQSIFVIGLTTVPRHGLVFAPDGGKLACATKSFFSFFCLTCLCQ